MNKLTAMFLNIDAPIRAKEAMDRPHDRMTAAELKAIRLQHRQDAAD